MIDKGRAFVSGADLVYDQCQLDPAEPHHHELILLARGPALSQTESGQHQQNDTCPQSV
jgi:hypothetical protein